MTGMTGDKTNALVMELQKYDNPEGYKLEYNEVKKRLGPCMKELVSASDQALDALHALLEHEGTWSCLFALEILDGIKSEKSVPYLIKFIEENDTDEYWQDRDYAMRTLTDIGKPAVPMLLQKVKEIFASKRENIFLTEALTGIEDERVYEFMVDLVRGYIKDYKKYDGWLAIHLFVIGFDKQGHKEVLPLLEELYKMGHLSEDETKEIEGTIKRIRDPVAYEEEIKRLVEEIDEHPDKFDRFQKLFDENVSLSDEERGEIIAKTKEADEDFEANFICNDCNERQNIKTGFIWAIDSDGGTQYLFAKEIMCKHCHGHSVKLSKEGEIALFGKAMRTLIGADKGVMPVGKETQVEDKRMSFDASYEYLMERLNKEPENGELYLRAGNVAMKQNKYDEAIDFFEKSIERNPKLIAPFISLTEIYLYRFKYYVIEGAREKAKDYLARLVALFNSGDYDTATINDPYMGHLVDYAEVLGLKLTFIDKLGRNDPCPCGSNKKYKKCCNW